MTLQDYKDRLAAMQDVWDQAPAELDSMPEDGDYQAIVERFEPFEGREDKLLRLRTELRIVHDPRYEGKIVHTVHRLERAPNEPEERALKAMSALKKHLSTLGVDPDHELTELFDRLRGALDVPVLIAVRTGTRTDSNGRPYRNVYVNERLGESIAPRSPGLDVAPAPTPAPSGRSAVYGDDDIPF